MKHILYLLLLMSLLSSPLKSTGVSPSNIKQRSPLSNTSYAFVATTSIEHFTNDNYSLKPESQSASISRVSGLDITPYPNRINGGSHNGIVGSTTGSFDVTPTGSAVYQIPLLAPPGTGGMTPQLSICYSSSTGDGLLGQGFYLSGLSMINRAPSNVFVDGRAGVVDFTTNDKFMLDGNRLIEIKYINATSREYRTENNSFSKIISSGGTAANPTTFTVYSKAGLIYEYTGFNTSVPSSLFWLVTKVSDTKGNYYTVTYDTDAINGEYWPKRIDYTGNDQAGLTPYCSIRFTTSVRNTARINYINGIKVSITRRLDAVEMYHGETRVKRYSLNYEYNSVPLLNSVTEYGSDGSTRYNPTAFSWHKTTSFSPTQVKYDTSSLLSKADFYPGDFNGDGKMDFIATPKKDAGWTGWRLFLSNGDSFTYAGSGTLMEGFKKIIVGDFNGDGKADIIQYRSTTGQYHNYFLHTSTGTNFIYAGPAQFTTSKKHEVLVGEFNADGAADLFVYYPGTRECNIIRSEFNGNEIVPLNYTATRYSTQNWDRGEIIDHNGDGLSDVMNLYADGYDLLYSDGYGTISTIKNGTWPNKDHHIYFGDFNGDGKSDMLLTGWKDTYWGDHQIQLSTGIGFERFEFSRYFDSNLKQVFVCDMNGDGRDDFFIVDRKSPTNGSLSRVQYYINQDGGVSFSAFQGDLGYGLDKWNYQVGDFNGDGRGDYLVTSNWTGSNWNGYQLYNTPTNPNNLLNVITDGLGNTTSISYRSMTDNSVHVKGNTNAYPVVSFSAPWKLVDKVTQSNGKGGVWTKAYQYKNALLHKRGRGVLGFEQFVVSDVDNNTVTTYTNEVETSKYVTALKNVEIKCNNKLIVRSEYFNSLKNYQYQVFTYGTTQTIERKYDYTNSAEYSTVITRNVFDNYGNVLRNVTKYNNTDSVVNVNTYDNLEDKWFLGRLKTAQVTKYKNGGTLAKASSFEYDPASGILKKETIEPGDQVLGFSKLYEHDAYGNISKSIHQNISGTIKRTQRSMYDTKGRFEEESFDQFENKTTYNINQVTGQIISETDANNITVSYTYDAFGNQTSVQSPLGNTVTAVRWSSGHEDAPAGATYFTYTETSGNPPVLEFFDSLGRSLRTKITGFDGKTVYTEVEYNAKGQVYRTSEPYFAGETVYWSRNEYDAVGRTVRQTLPDNSVNTIAYNGLKTTVTNALGQQNIKLLNSQGELIESTDNNGAKVTYTYKPDQITVTGPRTTINTYSDKMGNKVKMADPDIGTITYRYNAFGELTSQRNVAKPDSVVFEYDAGGRVKKRTEKEGITEYIYDTRWKGALSTVKFKAAIEQEFFYDDYGRVTSVTQKTDGREFVISTQYDDFSRVSTVTYPAGFSTKNIYNAYGYLAQVINTQSSQSYWKATKTNARGQLETFVLGNGLTTNRTYDAQKGYLKTVHTPGIQDWTYVFNTIGTLTSRKDNKRNLTERFEYDNLNRLTKTFHNNVSKEEVTYDAAGNLTFKTGVGSSFEYFAGTNKLKKINGGGYNPPDWDLIEYTSFDKISRVLQGADELLLTYGSGHSRIKAVAKRNNAATTTYYVGSLFEEEHLPTGEIKKRNYIFAGDGAVAINEQSAAGGETLRYLHKDHLGSIMAYSDKTGALVQELSYDAWGKRRHCDTWAYALNIADFNAWHARGFTAHEHLDIFEMINMDGRMYDPVLGRFLSPDPFVQAPDFTQGLNRYIYCLNNPLSFTDPSGYSWLSDNWKSLASAIVGIVVAAIPGGQGFGAAILAGALGGAAAGFTGAVLNGANFIQTVKATLTGAFWGAASAGLNFLSADTQLAAKLFKHAFSNMWLEGVRGGNMKHGLLSGLASAAGGSAIEKYGGRMSRALKVAANAVIGGTAEELGGGKFANGAITGAFSMLFNDLMHQEPPEKEKGNSRDSMGAMDWVQGGLDVAGLIPGIGEIADGINALIYVVNGDYINAGLSAAAMIPFAGWAATGAKVANKAVKLSETKAALKQVHNIMGGSLPKGTPGKFGSPQRGTSIKGYRLDPAHPGKPIGHPESVPHINYWDYTNGKKGKGGISGAIPIYP